MTSTTNIAIMPARFALCYISGRRRAISPVAATVLSDLSASPRSRATGATTARSELSTGHAVDVTTRCELSAAPHAIDASTPTPSPQWTPHPHQ